MSVPGWTLAAIPWPPPNAVLWAGVALAVGVWIACRRSGARRRVQWLAALAVACLAAGLHHFALEHQRSEIRQRLEAERAERLESDPDADVVQPHNDIPILTPPDLEPPTLEPPTLEPPALDPPDLSP